jgi:hypothetical protein
MFFSASKCSPCKLKVQHSFQDIVKTLKMKRWRAGKKESMKDVKENYADGT